MAAAPAGTSSKVNRPVFAISAALILAVTLWVAIDGEAYGRLESLFLDISQHLGWYFIFTAAVVVIFVLVVAITRVGNTKLGPDHSTPKFNLFTWTAMLFAAGIGVDLMFFSVVGPATNVTVGPGLDSPEEMAAAEQAAIWTMFHYGVPGWAMYALMGMAFGLFAYRYHLPLSIRSALYPIIGKRAQGKTGDAVEIGAVIGTIFGVATSLGIGVVFLSIGIEWLVGIESGPGVQVALVLLAALVVTVSTYTGVDQGIRRLAELNVLVAILLMLYVLFSGQTVYLLDALVKNLGDFFALFPGMLTETFAYDSSQEWLDAEWIEWWTIFFWAWWMAWAPFVGLFLARISRGRTLRQFIIGVLVVPFTFIAVWISIFGNATISRILDGDPEFAEEAQDFSGVGYYSLMADFPGATFIIGISVLVGLLFYVTSADSGALVLSNFTSMAKDPQSDGPRWLRMVWSFIIAGLTIAMLLVNPDEGIDSLQMATVIIGLPLSLILYLLMLGVWRALRLERYNAVSHQATLPSALSERMVAGSPGRWRRRLARHMHYASAEEVAQYLEETALPAIEEVAAELENQGADVSCSRGTVEDTDLPHIDLHVYFGEQQMFKYQVYPVEYSVPDFALNFRAAEQTYHRVEIFSATGSAGYDIFGYTKEQVISDVLDSYERHLAVLTMTDTAGTAAVPVDAEAIPDDWDHDRTKDNDDA